ncbi:ABC transporter substrate-binding protein [Phaeobacter sp. NW0010-22]|uniref:ABC transporter substrate-binding protein n=1 Tax=Phaeobacter sp. NW0010-22 TaxID=3135907 RepID=UPI003105AE5A
MRFPKFGLILTCLTLFTHGALAEVSVPVVYLKQTVERPPVLSNLDPIPEDEGDMGAQLGLADNLTTGAFLGHKYSLHTRIVPVGGDLISAAKEALAESDLIILDAPATDILAIADLEAAQDAVLFNVSSAKNALRDQGCRANVLHSLPSSLMRTDAIMQFARSRRWDTLALISGEHPDDLSYAHSLRRSATKFGMKLKSEKTWVFDADMRRNAAQEVPLFTQDLGKYDLLLIADEVQDFGRYIAYNTWLPRPVAGSEGLIASAWSPVVEQWGAAQLQSRFTELAGRAMRPKDYAAWAAIRTIGEAVTRTNSADTETLRGYILSDDFELAGFKGRPLSYRQWNGQLRQPIPLTQPRALVALAPLPGYLHQHSELDTLGLDRPESNCEAFQ